MAHSVVEPNMQATAFMLTIHTSFIWFHDHFLKFYHRSMLNFLFAGNFHIVTSQHKSVFLFLHQYYNVDKQCNMHLYLFASTKSPEHLAISKQLVSHQIEILYFHTNRHIQTYIINQNKEVKLS